MSDSESNNTQSFIVQDTIPFAPTKLAFDKHQLRIAAVDPKDMREARVDLNSVFSRTLTVLPVVHEMRSVIPVKLPDIDLDVYDSIEERLYAAHYCNTLWQAKVTAKEDLGPLADTLEDRYDDALFAFKILIQFRLADDEPLTRLKPASGHEALMHNAGLVLGVLRGLAPEMLSRTPLTAQDLELLEHHLLKLQTAWGRRRYTEQSRDEAAILRAQAFTYLYEAYELARRAALYLYGYDRGNQLVPSLYASNGERKRKSVSEEPAAGDSSALPEATPRPSPKPADVTPATFVMDNSANLPLTHPFEVEATKK